MKIEEQIPNYNTKEDEDFLDLFKISERKYIIGIFQDGITVYKQQIRALNIFHSLIQTKKIKIGENFSIAVIGGGVAGLTFAAACLKCNLKVRVFEKEANYLHMQYGCDTRKIHPNLYDWPETGALFPNAKLPVLGWTYDTASNVSKQIIKQFEEIKNEVIDPKDVNSYNIFDEYLNCKISDISEITDEIGRNFLITHRSKKIELYYKCNLIIYAIGYGIEKNLDKDTDSSTPSYWRNDALGQSILTNHEKEFIISGMGDGGLIDLFRLKIRDFSYDFILDVLKSDKDKYARLSSQLLEIKNNAPKTFDENNYYFTSFQDLSLQYYAYIFSELERLDRVRNDIVVTLLSRRAFNVALDFRKISLLNAFLAYIFRAKNYYTAKTGLLSFDKGSHKYKLDGETLENFHQPIVRYGTDRSTVIENKNLFLSVEEHKTLVGLEKIQQHNLYSHINSKWTFGQINSYFESGLNPQTRVKKRREYLTSDTIAICTSHVSVLAKILENFHKGKKHFRLALNRIIELDGKFHYQQITPYFGTKANIRTNGTQQVFPLERGIVGLSFKTGKPLLIVRKDEPDFQDLKSSLLITKTYDPLKDPTSFLTIPILGPIKPSKSKSTVTSQLSTNLVLFIDSSESDFFDKKEILDIIVSSIRGFIDYINKLIELKQIYMGELEFEPLHLNDMPLKPFIQNKCLSDVSGKYHYFKLPDPLLKLKEFSSFDIIYNKI